MVEVLTDLVVVVKYIVAEAEVVVLVAAEVEAQESLM